MKNCRRASIADRPQLALVTCFLGPGLCAFAFVDIATRTLILRADEHRSCSFADDWVNQDVTMAARRKEHALMVRWLNNTKRPTVLAVLAPCLLASCATQPLDDAAPRATNRYSGLTIEQVLVWSLEGPAGVERAMRELEARAQSSEPREAGDSITGPVMLADIALSSVWLRPRFTELDMMVDTTPCLSTERVATITGAGTGSPRITAHLENVGRGFGTRRNGVRVNFVSKTATIGCVNAIYIDMDPESTQ